MKPSRRSLSSRLSRALECALRSAAVCGFIGAAAGEIGGSEDALPSVQITEAPPLQFRGGNSPSPDKPGDTDCNSPAHWDGNTMYLFNSSGHPWRSTGSDLFHLDQDYRSCKYNNTAAGGRWVECTWKVDDGTLYGWYHFEPWGICVGSHRDPKAGLTAPRIGAVRSQDNGATWEDLGVILEAPPLLRCDTANYYFAGGNGDFCMMLDAKQEYAYFFISTYVGPPSEQGVAIARMRWGDRDSPVGKVWKWRDGKWEEPGLGGRVTPIFPGQVDWHEMNADAFWGPSVHWNTHLGQYVMLLNRSKDANWTQEGVYISFCRELDKPGSWSQPKRIQDPVGPDRWYPQIIGLDATKQETDKLAGKKARLFNRGLSKWEIYFLRPGENAPN